MSAQSMSAARSRCGAEVQRSADEYGGGVGAASRWRDVLREGQGAPPRAGAARGVRPG
jgi:hypothetical protein